MNKNEKRNMRREREKVGKEIGKQHYFVICVTKKLSPCTSSLSEISGSQGGEYEDGCLLDCCQVALMLEAVRTCEISVKLYQTTGRNKEDILRNSLIRDSHATGPLSIYQTSNLTYRIVFILLLRKA
jgi:hypothetical protein